MQAIRCPRRTHRIEGSQHIQASYTRKLASERNMQEACTNTGQQPHAGMHERNGPGQKHLTGFAIRRCTPLLKLSRNTLDNGPAAGG